MFHSSSIARLYANVIQEEIVRYEVNEQEIRRGVQIMANVYRPDPASLQLDSMTAANYNEIGLRCAYLHKNGAFHTALVLDVMNLILKVHKSLFQELVTAGQFKLCSLGGGPGADAIGILAALTFTFGIFKKDVVIVDIMEYWKLTFDAVIQEIVYGDYSITQNFSPHCFQWNYIGHNLLDSMSKPVNKAISNANFISMVKFVSATACQDTEAMVTKIFRVMKPGALVLFIDNAAGGFRQVVKRAARQVGLVTLFGDKNHLNHYKYSNDELQCIRFGYTSCCTTTVAIHLLQKPRQNQQTESYNLNHLQERNSNDPTTVFREPIPSVDNLLNTSMTRTNHHVSYLHTSPKPVYVQPSYDSPEPVYANFSYGSPEPMYEQSSYGSPEPVYAQFNYGSPEPMYVQSSYGSPEPVYAQPSYGRSSWSSTQFEPDASDDESTNDTDDCSCCVIS